MIAFVLSGAGNRGPLQVGAVRALLDQGIRPDFLVGTSAGAINGLFLAAHGVDDPTVTERLSAMWTAAKPTAIYPGNILQIGWRIWNKAESIYPNHGVRQMIADALPSGVQTFGDLKLPLYVATTDLTTLRLFLFGEDPAAPVVDAVLASAAVPVLHPPVHYRELQLIDGGVVATVPASIAMDHGATELYVINTGYDDSRQPVVDGIGELLLRTFATVVTQSLLVDLDRAGQDRAVDLHHIQLLFPKQVGFRDFTQGAAMAAAGYEQGQRYLRHPRPRTLAPAGVETRYGATVGAAREYIPPQLR